MSLLRSMRTYSKTNGSVIVVGENAHENDMLIELHREAAPHRCVWMHVQDQPSAHGFLTGPDPSPSNEDIRDCAALVKHWSKAKNEKCTTIMYTPLRNVSKKGCKAGQVTLKGDFRTVKSWGGERATAILTPLLELEVREKG